MRDTNEARRYTPDELGALDPCIPDKRIVWASTADASSKHSSSYAAKTACGIPSVFPEGGDRSGTWLAATGDDEPWITLEFEPVRDVAGVLVAETCGAGAVFEIRDGDSDAVLWRASSVKLKRSRVARLLYVPLPDAGSLSSLTLRVAPYDFGSEYKEIDGVALVTASIEELFAHPPSYGPARHRRYRPRELDIYDLKGDRRILWAISASASSTYGSSYGAGEACGRPNRYPRSGDNDKTWLSKNNDQEDWLDLRFPETDEAVHGVIVLETCGAGATYKMTTGTESDERNVWAAPPEDLQGNRAHLLFIENDTLESLQRLRLHLAPSKDYRQIDAVGLVTTPFEDLTKPAPPASRDDDWEVLQGELVGDSAFHHITLRTEAGARTVNIGGPLKLVLDGGGEGGGEEVVVETGRTTVYGGSTVQERGTFVAVSQRVPDLAGAFDELPDTRVELVGRSVPSGSHVAILGETKAASGGGFRDAAPTAPQRIEAAAIAVGANAARAFAKHGSKNYDAEAKRLDEEPPRRPHPARNAALWMLGFVAVCLTGLVSHTQHGGWATDPVGATLIFAASIAAVLGLEFVCRIMWVPSFLTAPGGGVKDRKVLVSSPWLVVVVTVVGLPILGPVAAAGFATAYAGVGEPTAYLGGALLVTSAFALLRLGLWSYRQSGALGTTVRLLMAGSGRTFTGRLSAAGSFSRTDTYTVHTIHLGTHTTTDDEGRVTTHERHRTWYERAVSGKAPSRICVVLEDGSTVETRAAYVLTTHLGGRLHSGQRDVIARYSSKHETGDVATLVGTPKAGAEGEASLDEETPMYLVLGDYAELRSRALVQCAAIFLLLAIAVAGPLAAFL